MNRLLIKKNQFIRFVVLLLAVPCICGADARGNNEVLVVGDTRLKPVVQVIAGIEEIMGRKVVVYAPDEVDGKLASLVEQHAARAVIALGRPSIDQALTLPPSVIVLYDLVVLPPPIDRPNTAGMYMGTPIREYLHLVSTYLPHLKNICVIASPGVVRLLNDADPSQVTVYEVTNTYEFVETVKNLEKADAVLLLPDLSLLTNKALEEIYLFSFREKVPLLGISKKHVREGSLFALEFDPESSGRSLGMMAEAALKQQNSMRNQALPPRHFNLYINRNTADKMGIAVPEAMLKKATQVYP
ncbi:MAG: hypothetical protein HY885_00765 [Deltaproteobacteria bacterium]|nr:hypothetical protein [Deltaproteobacteria bacterium]